MADESRNSQDATEELQHKDSAATAIFADSKDHPAIKNWRGNMLPNLRQAETLPESSNGETIISHEEAARTQAQAASEQGEHQATPPMTDNGAAPKQEWILGQLFSKLYNTISGAIRKAVTSLTDKIAKKTERPDDATSKTEKPDKADDKHLPLSPGRNGHVRTGAFKRKGEARRGEPIANQEKDGQLYAQPMAKAADATTASADQDRLSEEAKYSGVQPSGQLRFVSKEAGRAQDRDPTNIGHA